MSAPTRKEWGLGMLFGIFAFLLTIVGNYVWWWAVEQNSTQIPSGPLYKGYVDIDVRSLL